MINTQDISAALRTNRLLEAVTLYQAALTDSTGEATSELRHRFGETIERIDAAAAIDGASLSELALSHAEVRRADARRMIIAASQALVRLGACAASGDSGADARLKNIGAAFETLVVEGRLQQQFCGKLAIRLGLEARPTPKPVVEGIVRPLIEALVVVLLVGAPKARDSAVEGLGALLSLVPHEDPEHLVRALRIDGGNPDRDDNLRDRVERRRLMVLAVAGHARSQDEFHRKLKEELDTSGGRSAADLETEIWTRADFLRILPAIARQAGNDSLPWSAAELLRNASLLPPARDEAPESTHIAFAGYQESVFRTMDAMLRRPGADWSDFDEAVAGAVRAIPRTLAGESAICNRKIRATIAIIRTAIHLVALANGRSTTERALEPLFTSLRTPTLWANHGIAEGCYRGLPYLLDRRKYNERFSEPALAALFERLSSRSGDASDLVATHGRLVAAGAFRSILLSLTESLHERLLLEDDESARSSERKVEHDIRTLLENPDGRGVLRAFQYFALDARTRPPTGIAELVIATIAFESALLRGTQQMLAQWDVHPRVEQVLLARILALHLRAISRDKREIGRHQALRRVFDEMSTVAMSDDEAMELAWQILSTIPAEAAAATDADIQRFLEYRGTRNRASSGAENRVDDLPGYALAMIRTEATSRIASAVAREIDLNLRHERLFRPENFDFARSLYQVVLRGPHEAVFHHLEPRLTEPDDSRIAALFRKHVASVAESHATTGYALSAILMHVRDIVGEIDNLPRPSPTLQRLRHALALYSAIGSGAEEVWELIRSDKVLDVFRLFDDVAEAAHGGKIPAEDPRGLLRLRYGSDLGAMQQDVAHYLELPVGKFVDRAEALRKAAAMAKQVKSALESQPGLQPPERVLLVTLLRSLRGMFDRTIRWYCDEPRRRREEHDREGFRLLFTVSAAFWKDIVYSSRWKARQKDESSQPAPPEVSRAVVACRDTIRPLLAFSRASRQGLFRSFRKKENDKSQAFEEAARDAAANRIIELRDSEGPEPPRFREQAQRFEEYFVSWMAAELDVQQLRRTLLPRWPGWFRLVYETITNFPRTCLGLLVPCVIAVVCDLSGAHAYAGAGFFAVALGMCFVVLFSFTRLVERIRNHVTQSTSGAMRGKAGYWFQCMLPRLARLIVVPMALIVEFDHSYAFPLHGSTWVLLLLMVLAFLTTQFFVTREIVDRTERPGVFDLTRPERARVRQIVAVALAHSFGVAVLMSMIFGTTHVHEMKLREPSHGVEKVDAELHDDGLWAPVAAVLRRFDATDEHNHYPRFLGLLPREAALDAGAFFEGTGWIPPDVRRHITFTFYPTIILSWTALGLFFGVFLEGFVKGERLRGGVGGSEGKE